MVVNTQKSIWTVIICLLLALVLVTYKFRYPSSDSDKSTSDAVAVAKYVKLLKLRLDDKYDSKTAFFVDLTRPSSQYRFFVLDLHNEKLVTKGLACNGKTDSEGKVIYSNVPESNCSSKGFYRVGGLYTGKFGRSYKLHGLDDTNNNAYARAVVLHGHICVPAQPIGMGICESQGCPTVNPAFLDTLTTYINASRKPVLLYIN